MSTKSTSQPKSPKPKLETTLESQFLKNILRASKKSKDPAKIATAYGILTDKIVKSNGVSLVEIKETAKLLLAEISRAIKVSTDPNHIAIAFGILKDKNAFGSPKENGSGEKYDASPKKRKSQYEELLNAEQKTA